MMVLFIEYLGIVVLSAATVCLVLGVVVLRAATLGLEIGGFFLFLLGWGKKFL